MSNGRGKGPSHNTLIQLWTSSGGRCQFEGCNCKVFRDDLTGQEFNAANVAHIVAASPNGPRGNAHSPELSDKIENLMLLCPTHHKEVDSFPAQYPPSRLREMKERQEQKVQALLDCMYYPKSEIVALESPIKGKIPVHVDSRQTIEALRGIQKNPANTYPVLLKPTGIGEYRSPEYWAHMEASLEQSVENQINNRLAYDSSIMLSVFPLAPIPIIAKLGELLGDKRNIDIFQKTREPDTWKWTRDDATNIFTIERNKRKTGDPEKYALILSLTAEVSEQRVTPVYDAGIIYQIKAAHYGVDCIQSREDLKLFWQAIQKVCDYAVNQDHAESLAVFPAIPVSAAFEIGRRHMAGVHPRMTIYDDDNGFFSALQIGG